MNPASEQFYQRFLAFQKANPGMVHVVRKGEDDDGVRAWFTYFQVRGQTGTIRLFQQLLNDKKAVQFPCKKPELFDLTYDPPRHQYRDPSTGEVSRSDVSAVVEKTMHSLRNAKPKGRQPVPRDHLLPPTKTPKEWLDDYLANPPPIPVFSEEFKARMGLGRKDDEAA